MIRITVHAPADEANFNKLALELKTMGIHVEEIVAKLGIIHGKISKEGANEKIKAVAKLQNVVFVSTSAANSKECA